MSGDRLREVCAELVEALDAELDLFETRHSDLIDRARALLAEAQPQPVEPTDAQLDELWAEVEGSGAIWAWQHYARAVLARWGSPAPEPVSVSNRLPTQELNELDDQGTCWMFHQLNFHYCLCRPDPSVHTHWLPHWALPVPQEQADA
jgi:hypothetical protein